MNEDELAEFLESGRRPDGAVSPADAAAESLRDLLADDALWAEPPAGGADALLAAIRAEQGGAAPAPLPGAPLPPAPAAPGPSAPSGPPVEPPRRGDAVHLAPVRQRRRWPVAALGAAAALVLVAGVVGVALRASDEGGGREVAMSGTELAPDASGVAEVEETDSGVDIVLDVTGLEPAPPGTYYQAWVKGPDGLVTVGTFHLRGGDASINLWSGVDLERYPTLTVTLQQEGAGQESSGQVVLTGEIG